MPQPIYPDLTIHEDVLFRGIRTGDQAPSGWHSTMSPRDKPLQTNIIQPPPSTYKLGDPYRVEGNTILPYSKLNPLHTKGFIDLLIYQGRAHGHEIHPVSADGTSHQIGQDLEVTMLTGKLGEKDGVAKGMTVLSHISCAAGPIKVLDDVIVDPNARGEGLAAALLYSNLLDLWDEELQMDGMILPYAGYTWEMTRKNFVAEKLYRKIDPTFKITDCNHVLVLSEEQIENINRVEPIRAHLATLGNMDLTRISTSLTNLPAANSDFISMVMARQGNGYAQGFAAPAKLFVCTANEHADHGAFAFAGAGCSTFKSGAKRNIVRIHLATGRDGKIISSADEVCELMRRVSTEMLQRRWRGPAYIEICNELSSLASEEQVIERKKIIDIQKGLMTRHGAKQLRHGGAKMVSANITGKKLIQAVAVAAENTPQRPLSLNGQRRLRREAVRYNIDLSQIRYMQAAA
jgi:hypothetical protein